MTIKCPIGCESYLDIDSVCDGCLAERFPVVRVAGGDLALARGEFDVLPDEGDYDVYMIRTRCVAVD